MMKHAITLLKAELENARENERRRRTANELKEARAAQAVAWDCLDAITVLEVVAVQRAVAAKLAKAERKAQKGGQKP